MAAEKWQIVEVTLLVREDSAGELHDHYGRMIQHDESSSGFVETRDLTEKDHTDFDHIIEEIEGDEDVVTPTDRDFLMGHIGAAQWDANLARKSGLSGARRDIYLVSIQEHLEAATTILLESKDV